MNPPEQGTMDTEDPPVVVATEAATSKATTVEKAATATSKKSKKVTRSSTANNQGEISIEAALQQAHAIEQQLKAAHQELQGTTTVSTATAAATPTTATPTPTVATTTMAMELDPVVPLDISNIKTEVETPPAGSPKTPKEEGSGRKGYCYGVLLRKCSCEFPEDCRTLVRHWCEPVDGQPHRDARRAGYLEIPWFRQYASTEHTLFKNQQRQVYLHHIRSKKKTPLVEGAPNSRARTYVALHHFPPETLKPDGKGLVDVTTEDQELVKKLKLKKNLERINIPGHVQHNTFFVPPNFQWRELIDAFLQSGGLPCELKQIVPSASQKEQAGTILVDTEPSGLLVSPPLDSKKAADRRLADGVALRRCECNFPDDCRKLVMHWCQLVGGTRRDPRRAGYICLPRPQDKTDTTLRKYKQAKRQVYLKHLTDGVTSLEEHDQAAAKKGNGSLNSSGGYNPQYVALHHWPPEFLKEDGSGLKNEVVDTRFVEKLTISKDDAVPKNEGWFFVPPCHGWRDLREDFVKTGGSQDQLNFSNQSESRASIPRASTASPVVVLGGVQAKDNEELSKRLRMDPALKNLLRKIDQDKEAFARDYLAMEKQSTEMKEELRGNKSQDETVQKELSTVRNDLQSAKDRELMLRADASKGLTRHNLMDDAWHSRFPEAASILLGFSEWSEFKFFVTQNFKDVPIEGAEGRVTDFEKICMATMRAHRSYDYGIIGLIYGHNRRRVGEWVAKFSEPLKGLLEAEQKKARSRNACFHLTPSSDDKMNGVGAEESSLPQTEEASKPAAMETPLAKETVATPTNNTNTTKSTSSLPKRSLPLQHPSSQPNEDSSKEAPLAKKARKKEEV